VYEAAQQVEMVDAELRAELGLAAADEAVTIQLVTTLQPFADPTILAQMSNGATLYATSPALLPLSAQISEGDALIQLVAGLLVNRDLDDALVASPPRCHWRNLVRGLHLWWLWEHDRLPSQARYAMRSRLAYQIAHGAPPSLTWLDAGHTPCSTGPIMREQVAHATRDVAGSHTADGVAPALVEYAMYAYGRDRIPALIEGMNRYDSWEELIPAVYGVSAADFEAGWQEWLTATVRTDQ
jgi:hypothetical protein